MVAQEATMITKSIWVAKRRVGVGVSLHWGSFHSGDHRSMVGNRVVQA